MRPELKMPWIRTTVPCSVCVSTMVCRRFEEKYGGSRGAPGPPCSNRGRLAKKCVGFMNGQQYFRRCKRYERRWGTYASVGCGRAVGDRPRTGTARTTFPWSASVQHFLGPQALYKRNRQYYTIKKIRECQYILDFTDFLVFCFGIFL